MKPEAHVPLTSSRRKERMMLIWRSNKGRAKVPRKKSKALPRLPWRSPAAYLEDAGNALEGHLKHTGRLPKVRLEPKYEYSFYARWRLNTRITGACKCKYRSSESHRAVGEAFALTRASAGDGVPLPPNARHLLRDFWPILVVRRWTSHLLRRSAP